MKLSDELVVIHAEIIQGNYSAAVKRLCNVLELCRLNIKYPDDGGIMYNKLENLIKTVTAKEIKASEM